MDAMEDVGIAKRLNVVLVSPKYQINLGYAARVLKNFGVRRLCMVRPRCRVRGATAIKYAKHGRSLLEGAVVFDSLQDAVRGSTIVIGTTGIWRKGSGAFMNVYTPAEAVRMLPSSGKISILIGRDDTGLTREEIAACDATVHIPASPSYPVLNISHALAIVLYEIMCRQGGRESMHSEFGATQAEIDRLVLLFSGLVDGNSGVRNRDAVISAFRHVVFRANPTSMELSTISAAFGRKYRTDARAKKNENKKGR